jgi:hypothetical protein
MMRGKHIAFCAIAGAIFIIVLSLGPLRAADLEPKRAGQEAFISRAVFAQGSLWVLSDSGLIATIQDSKSGRAPVTLPEPALDLWLEAGTPAVLTCAHSACERWSIRRLVDGAWTTEATLSSKNDHLVGVNYDGGVRTILTTQRIIRWTGKASVEARLSEAVDTFGVASLYVGPQGLFVGFNRGEWGGGLKRIDPKSGRVTVIERNATNELCGGPLNTQCDPVNGIASLPWQPDCVAIAIGLVHFAPHGRIATICGTVVESLYTKPLANPSKDDNTIGGSGDEAFFGLARQGDVLWSVGIDGLYKIGAGGVVQSFPLPEFKERDGVWVSFARPELVLVLTNVNQRRSISGAVPLLVPR